MIGGNIQDMSHMIVIKRVKEHSPIPAVLDQMVFPQDAKLMGNSRAVDSGRQGEIANAKLAITERRQHPLPGWIAQHAKEPGHLSIPRNLKTGSGGPNLMGMNTQLVAKIVVRDTPPSDMCTYMHILRRHDGSNKNPALRNNHCEGRV
jgi:hypothetical protein